MFAPGDAELDLAGDIAAHGKTSRLYRELVYERRIAVDVSAYQSSREMSGIFQVIATAAPGRGLDEIAEAITAALASLAAEGPAASEMERSLVQTEAQFVFRLQTVGGFGGKSDQLNAYNVFRDDPGYFAADRARYQAATPASVAATVRRYLVDAPRVALSVVPKGAAHLALADSTPVVAQ
jgi:zinc protease